METLIEQLPGGAAGIAGLSRHAPLLLAIFLASLATFVGSLVALPLIIARLPEEHFLPGQAEPRFWRELPVWARPVLLGLKNALGLLFLACGLLLLAFPGQGLVTILIGLSMIDFPGKHHLERRLIARPTIWRATAWIRRRAGRPPFIIP